MTRSRARALVVGVGGLGCPAALALARAGVGVIGLCDDDAVERSNLHRQILYRDQDVGDSKLDAAARALAEHEIGTEVGTEGGTEGGTDRQGGRPPTIVLHRTRLLPENAVAMVSNYDVVLEGSDNFATKFLTADACALARVPVVHASAVRWIGTVLAVGAGAKPCYRCLFEDVPGEDVPNCAEAGVFGPVVGIVAAAQVDLALASLNGVAAEGRLVTFDGLVDAVRQTTVRPRAECPLCGASPRIRRIDANAYVSPACAG